MVGASHWRSEGYRLDSHLGFRNIFLSLQLSLSNSLPLTLFLYHVNKSIHSLDYNYDVSTFSDYTCQDYFIVHPFLGIKVETFQINKIVNTFFDYVYHAISCMLFLITVL